MMGEVIHVDTRRRESFELYAVKGDDGRWQINVSWYDKSVAGPEVFREVAEALIPISGGLIVAAEGIDPSTRGTIVANFNLYEDGNISLHCPLEMSDDMRRFIIIGLERAKHKIKDLSLNDATDR